MVPVTTLCLKNAIEAMPHGGNIFIDYELIQENRRIIVTFIDKGIGIDRNVLRYLVTPFYTSKDKEIGLGLTVKATKSFKNITE
ncbi:ATP-binding protein [Bacillus sp. MRMR6]|uniref:ATP-binding protein n=1 Tax=Bacillus sp. MRMR6 TaxID=1928617 RepID=UPI0009533C38|nr:ATP-binding protein [Bacillus sp. MRMR6]OLS41015.1 hypothetical protein BTR25_06735 [Bacillus sp. MRMR6]